MPFRQLTITLLAGYWAMITFIPVPGFGAGDYAEAHNLANWIDKNYLPYFKWDGDHDPGRRLRRQLQILTRSRSGACD